MPRLCPISGQMLRHIPLIAERRRDLGTDRKDTVALLYVALQSLDITRLFSAWNAAQAPGGPTFSLTTELCGATAQFNSPDLTLHIQAHLSPRTGEEFANVLTGAPDKARLASLIAGHQHHLTLTAEGGDSDLRLGALQQLCEILCDLATPEAIHWEPAARLFLTDDFRKVAARDSRAHWRLRAALSAHGLRLLGAKELLGHEVQLIDDTLSYEDAEQLAFDTADRLLNGWAPELGTNTTRTAPGGQEYQIRFDYASDGTLCIRVATPDMYDNRHQNTPRIPKLALILSKTKEARSAAKRSGAVVPPPPADPDGAMQARPAGPPPEDALRDVFRPPTRLQRWLGA